MDPVPERRGVTVKKGAATLKIPRLVNFIVVALLAYQSRGPLSSRNLNFFTADKMGIFV
jgi:hypothetical protein